MAPVRSSQIDDTEIASADSGNPTKAGIQRSFIPAWRLAMLALTNEPP